MVSAQIDGILKFYRITPTGSKIFIYGGHTKALAPSGSSVGVIASTPEKWVLLPILMGSNQEKILRVNDRLHVTFTPTPAATTDASDCAWVLPITYQDGSSDILDGPSVATTWDAFVLGDVALIAAREYPVCEKVVRQSFTLGGGKIFASIEDNA